MTDIGICDQDNIRCCGHLRGGAQRFRQNHHKTFRIGGRAQRVGVNERTLLSVWVPKSTSSSVPLEGFLRGPRQPIRPSGPIGAKTRSRISKPLLQQRCSSSRHRLSNSKLIHVTRQALFPRLHQITCGPVERILEGDSDPRTL